MMKCPGSKWIACLFTTSIPAIRRLGAGVGMRIIIVIRCAGRSRDGVHLVLQCLLGCSVHGPKGGLTTIPVAFLRDSEELYGLAGIDAGALGQAIRKELWICPGAEHCQLWEKEKVGFESRVVVFLNKFM